MTTTSASCAACGKGGGDLKACTVCKQVSYCNAACRNAHRSAHKKDCKKAAKALEDTSTMFDVEEIPDEELFKDPPAREECPICMLPMPFSSRNFNVAAVPMSCCNASICTGCIGATERAMAKDDIKRLCLFCREPVDISQDEELQRFKRRAELGDAKALHWLGCGYQEGRLGSRSTQDKQKMMEYWVRAAKLGSVESHYKIGITYYFGKMVPKDAGRARYHLSLAAIGGHELARYTLGLFNERRGKAKAAMKHFLISASEGGDSCLEKLREGYKQGMISKDEYAKVLRASKQFRDEMKSDQRDEYAEAGLKQLRSRFPHMFQNS